MYQPPELTEEETSKLKAEIMRKISRIPHQQLIVSLVHMAIENAKLKREINTLRALQGIEPMKGFKP